MCKIHAQGLFNEVYGSILNDTRQIPTKKRKELQRVRTVALMHSLSFYRNLVFTSFSTSIKNKQHSYQCAMTLNSISVLGLQHKLYSKSKQGHKRQLHFCRKIIRKRKGRQQPHLNIKHLFLVLRTFALIVCAQRYCAGNATVICHALLRAFMKFRF